MANPLRGEASFEAQGQVWTMVLDFNTLVSLEKETGSTLQELFELLKPERLSLGTIRSFFKCSLEENHGDVTDREAGNLIGEIGIEKAATLLSEAVNDMQAPVAKAPAGPPVNRQQRRATQSGRGKKA